MSRPINNLQPQASAVNPPDPDPVTGWSALEPAGPIGPVSGGAMEPDGVSAVGEPAMSAQEMRWLLKAFKRRGGNARYPVRHQGARETARRGASR